MKSDIKKVFFSPLVLLVFSLISLPRIAGSTTDKDHLTIVFTSGMSEIYLEHDQGGHAHLQTFLQKVRKADDQVIFIHGGDALSPGILSTIDKGAHMISILNDLSPDVMAVSKSDLAHQEDTLSLRTFEASFPIINCNIYDPLKNGLLEGLLPYFIKKIGNYRIGFVSVVDPEVIADYMPQRITTTDINRALAENSNKLRRLGADIVILVAGISIDSFNAHFSNPPVDIVLLSQTNGETGLTQQGNSLFQLRGHKGMASIITLKLRKNESTANWTCTGTGKTIQLKDYKPDHVINNKIQSYLTQLSVMLERVVGMTRTDFNTERESVRTGENAFANFTADSLRSYYHSDIALINGGSFRANKQYPSGSNLTVGDIRKELPFNSRVVNLRVTGNILKTILEKGLSRIDEIKGCFPHVSGITVEYNPLNPPRQRVVSISLNGSPLDPQKTYDLTTIDFLANGGEGFNELKNCERIIKIEETRLLWEYVSNYIEKKGAISPEIDGRMKIIQQ